LRGGRLSGYRGALRVSTGAVDAVGEGGGWQREGDEGGGGGGEGGVQQEICTPVKRQKGEIRAGKKGAHLM